MQKKPLEEPAIGTFPLKIIVEIINGLIRIIRLIRTSTQGEC